MVVVMEYNLADKIIMALTIWREARGEGYEGMQAVANVIKNNALAVGHSVYAECTMLDRYSSMTVPSDPQTTHFPKETDSAWRSAQSIAFGVLAGVIKDNTNGARYYCVAGTEGANPWFKTHIVEDIINHPFLVKIGKQDFYK